MALLWLVVIATLQLCVGQVLASHAYPNLPNGHPFNITCYQNGSINILANDQYVKNLFVVGTVKNSKPCHQHSSHFNINSKPQLLSFTCQFDSAVEMDELSGNRVDIVLDPMISGAGSSITIFGFISKNRFDKNERAFLIEVQDRPPTTTTASTPKPSPKPLVIGGNSSTVYRVTCNPDKDGDPVNVTMKPGVSVKANASELVLPDLQIGTFAKSMTATPDMTTKLPSFTLASEVQLVIYNDHRGGRMSYMLIPSKCVAHPENKPTVTLTLLNDDRKNCTYENTLMSTFTVTNTTENDLAYATLYPFIFERYPDLPVVLECTVYICPKDDKVDGVRTGYCEKQALDSGANRCSKLDPTSGYKKRRRRDVGVGDGGVTRATLRTTFTVQEPLMAGASRCSKGIWALVALMYLFK